MSVMVGVVVSLSVVYISLMLWLVMISVMFRCVWMLLGVSLYVMIWKFVLMVNVMVIVVSVWCGVLMIDCCMLVIVLSVNISSVMMMIVLIGVVWCVSCVLVKWCMSSVMFLVLVISSVSCSVRFDGEIDMVVLWLNYVVSSGVVSGMNIIDVRVVMSVMFVLSDSICVIVDVLFDGGV